MQRKKSREETAAQVFLNIADIARLLDVSWQTARKIYRVADLQDNEELGLKRIEPHKVRITTVCHVTGISLVTLQRQIKSASPGMMREV